MHAFAVIGANYGDEGKGLLTDYLVNREKADVVVRFNGGAQAGHTVVSPDGKRHVFSHFSSGTLQNAKTFLARQFIVNPILFFKEKEKLEALGFKKPIVWVDPRCMITTPYDMLINQAHERFLDRYRRGSCGVGFGETVVRAERSLSIGNYTSQALQLSINDLYRANAEYLHFKLQLLRHEWVPARLAELGMKYTPELKTQVLSDDLMWKFLEDLDRLKSCVFPRQAKDVEEFHVIVFEGAQGLGLDQVQGHFPHVTRSFTGLENIIDFCKEANVQTLDAHYVTRAYLTRHGAGPMENELKAKPYQGIVEKTNVTNEFQGAFRYGNLDVTALRDRIRVDLRTNTKGVRVNPKLAVTCLDQIDDVSRFIENERYRRFKRDEFGVAVAQAVGLPYVIESYGPTRADVKEQLAL